MTELDKMIKGVRCCREMENPPGWRVGGCEDCPYLPYREDGYGCTKRLKDDLRDMLEAQEPRVLTLEELEDWDGAVFFEAIETDMYYVLIETVEPSAGMKGTYVFINVEHGEHYRRVWDGEHYGSIWRCWTSRPTVEQRKAVPWND